MSISVYVREYGGPTVESYLGPGVEQLVVSSYGAPERFPLLSGIDTDDETVFNERQCKRLRDELHVLADEADDDVVRSAAHSLIELTQLLMGSERSVPAHRTLYFNGG
ncbi:hypothetical protein [Kineococcus sp. SYSU DK004]|uniref:hypothetical protein n=1 Tax=Kineococcus sp. SYSU DK004 TaxID=3383125 RepID=UPI003D7DD8B7